MLNSYLELRNLAMSSSPQQPAPPTTSYLFGLRAELDLPREGGEGPLGRRVWNAVATGSFEGPRLRGEVLAGSGDWMLIRRDGAVVIDARVILRTVGSAIIHMTY